MTNENSGVPPVPPPPPTYIQVQAPFVPTPPGNGLAITSMVLGIVGVFLFWLYSVVPILAIVFGGVAMSKAKQAGAKPSGMAIAGLVLGIVFTALFFLLVVIAAARN